MDSTADKKTVYELAYLLKTGESDAVIFDLLKEVKAEIVNKGPANPVQLAYPILKQTTGTFGYVHLTVPTSDVVKTVSDTLLLKPAILRFMFTKVPKKPKVVEAVPAVATVATATATGARATKRATPAIEPLSNEKLEQTLEEILK